jgi:hypothetical protein
MNGESESRWERKSAAVPFLILPDTSFVASPWILVNDDPILAMSWADSVVASPWYPAQ